MTLIYTPSGTWLEIGTENNKKDTVLQGIPLTKNNQTPKTQLKIPVKNSVWKFGLKTRATEPVSLLCWFILKTQLFWKKMADERRRTDKRKNWNLMIPSVWLESLWLKLWTSHDYSWGIRATELNILSQIESSG